MSSELPVPSGETALLRLFLDELMQRTEVLDDGAARLSVDDADPVLVDLLWREAHTLKGGASMVAVADVVELAAEIEAMLGAVRDGRLAVSAVLLDDLRDAISELREAGASAANEAGRTAQGPADEAPTSDVTVLVVDDDHLVREVLRRLLEGAGHAVVTAETASAALGVLASRSVDLVISDLEMPGGGVALVQAMRDEPSTKHVPVVVLSALADDDDERDLIASGADAVHSKTELDRAALLALVARHVKREG